MGNMYDSIPLRQRAEILAVIHPDYQPAPTPPLQLRMSASRRSVPTTETKIEPRHPSRL